MVHRLALAAALAVTVAGAAAAQDSDPLGQFRDWGAYSANSGNGKVCYVISQPTRALPEGVNRGSIYFFVTHRPSQDVRNEVSVIIGYPYREGSEARVEVGSDEFTMMTSNDGAWIENAAEESRLIQAMRAGSEMTVRGTSQRGTDTTDTYSLLGVSAALDRINQECS